MVQKVASTIDVSAVVNYFELRGQIRAENAVLSCISVIRHAYMPSDNVIIIYFFNIVWAF